MVVPSPRDLGAAIVTAAGCLAWWGVEKFAGWLSASTPASLAGATLARWQWVNIAAFAVNVVSVAIPGRIDDEMAEQMKKEAKEEAEQEKLMEVAAKMEEDFSVNHETHQLLTARRAALTQQMETEVGELLERDLKVQADYKAGREFETMGEAKKRAEAALPDAKKGKGGKK